MFQMFNIRLKYGYLNVQFKTMVFSIQDSANFEPLKLRWWNVQLQIIYDNFVKK